MSSLKRHEARNKRAPEPMTESGAHLVELADFVSTANPPDRLRLLSYNIQSGIQTASYRHYVTKVWQHLLPSLGRQNNLHRIAEVARHFDVVAFQELDAGSFRSAYKHQLKVISEAGNFANYHHKVLRDFGWLAQHGAGFVTNLEPKKVKEHSLPGPPGRGAIELALDFNGVELNLLMVHLSLGAKTQAMQLDYLAEQAEQHEHLVIMGDLNAEPDYLHRHHRLNSLGLELQPLGATFPSWSPRRALDHFLISPGLKVEKLAVLNERHSDHLPVAIELSLH